jgi:GNAT superfamily N-acetyltransferase
MDKYTLTLLILENRGKGIDHYLMNYAEQLAKEHGCVGT